MSVNILNVVSVNPEVITLVDMWSTEVLIGPNTCHLKKTVAITSPTNILCIVKFKPNIFPPVTVLSTCIIRHINTWNPTFIGQNLMVQRRTNKVALKIKSLKSALKFLNKGDIVFLLVFDEFPRLNWTMPDRCSQTCIKIVPSMSWIRQQL